MASPFIISIGGMRCGGVNGRGNSGSGVVRTASYAPLSTRVPTGVRLAWLRWLEVRRGCGHWCGGVGRQPGPDGCWWWLLAVGTATAAT
jgi:hypothetical protein